MRIKTHLVPSLVGKVNWPDNDSIAFGNCYDVDVAMVLKEGAICPSNPFQHAAELMLNHQNIKEEFMTMQGCSGHDYDCTSQRSIVSFAMIMIQLKLQHLIAIKNASGHSSCNLVERPMGSATFGIQSSCLYRLEASAEIENKRK